jgi:hypothetical protein
VVEQLLLHTSLSFVSFKIFLVSFFLFHLFSSSSCFTFSVISVFLETKNKKKMATLIVPPIPPSPRDDATQLYRAFKGILSLSLSLSLSLIDVACMFFNCFSVGFGSTFGGIKIDFRGVELILICLVVVMIN